nr:hypothetical protein [Gammaproteobacteria bacterium]
MGADSRRLSILTAREIDDLYGLPRFTENDRVLYFDLSPAQRLGLKIDALTQSPVSLINAALGRPNGQACQVGNLGEVRERAGNANETSSIPGSNGEIGILPHALENIRPYQRGGLLTKCRSLIPIDRALGTDNRVITVLDGHSVRDEG